MNYLKRQGKAVVRLAQRDSKNGLRRWASAGTGDEIKKKK
jgi:hypothetical protein